MHKNFDRLFYIVNDVYSVNLAELLPLIIHCFLTHGLNFMLGPYLDIKIQLHYCLPDQHGRWFLHKLVLQRWITYVMIKPRIIFISHMTWFLFWIIGLVRFAFFSVVIKVLLCSPIISSNTFGLYSLLTDLLRLTVTATIPMLFGKRRWLFRPDSMFNVLLRLH